MNFKQKFYGISLTTWILSVVIVIYFYNYVRRSNNNDIQINLETFEEQTNQSDSIKVYNFNASWCGWSKKFQSEWNKFEQECNSLDNVEAIDVKCDSEDKKSFCNNFSNNIHNIRGFPSVMFEKGDQVIEYQGPRTSEGLLDALNEFKKA